MCLSSVPYNIVEFEPFFSGAFIFIISFRVSKAELFLLFLAFDKILCHLLGQQFRQVNVLLFVSEGWNLPLSFLLIPL